ncbi:MAG: phosphatase PAP2 family protein [Deltaproteobacteria bacterium]|jgi:membrane-associated phospholipid phosphatase|nr:phosphatase PAP2 family protein [Deltaproteobacteria bacterium]
MPQKAVATALALFLIASVSSARAGWVERTDRRVERAGDIGAVAIPLSALAYSLAIGDHKGALQLTGSVAASMLLTEILKRTVLRKRPYHVEGDRKDSFPSGHTTLAFAGAAYWHRRYGWEIGVPMLAAASAVGYSRVYAYRHHWSDVMAGAVIGSGVTLLITGGYRKPGAHVSVTPTPGGARLDVGWAY